MDSLGPALTACDYNLVINRQRKISVNAFTKFYALIKDADPATKIELVKQAAQTIFAQGATGFLSKGRSDMPLSQLVTALIKSGKPKCSQFLWRMGILK